jgi:hypothetical protein
MITLTINRNNEALISKLLDPNISKGINIPYRAISNNNYGKLCPCSLKRNKFHEVSANYEKLCESSQKGSRVLPPGGAADAGQ